MKLWKEPTIQDRDEWKIHLDPLFKGYRNEIAKIVDPEKGGPLKRKIRRLTKTFPYCKNWRKSAGLDIDYKIRIN